MPAAVPTDEAVRTANAFLGLMRERATPLPANGSGPRLAEFQWPYMDVELRDAEPHAKVVLQWLIRSGHLTLHKRAVGGLSTKTDRFATYRVTLDRQFTEEDLARARKRHAKNEVRRQTRRHTPDPTTGTVGPRPGIAPPHAHAKQWDDERTLRMDVEAPSHPTDSALDATKLLGAVGETIDDLAVRVARLERVRTEHDLVQLIERTVIEVLRRRLK